MPVRRVIVRLQGPASAALASDEAAGPGPGILLVHDAWGLDEEMAALAAGLAAAGFRVLAPDLLAGRIAGEATEALALAGGLDPVEAGSLLAAAVDVLTGGARARDPAAGALAGDAARQALARESAAGALAGDRAAQPRAIGVVGIGMGAPLAAFAATLRPEIAVAVLDGPVPELAIETWERAEARLVVVAAPDDPGEFDPEALLDAPRAAGLAVEVVARPAGDPETIGRHLGAMLRERLPADHA